NAADCRVERAGVAVGGLSDVVVQLTRELGAQGWSFLGNIKCCYPVDAIIERLTEQQGELGLFESAALVTLVINTAAEAVKFLDWDQVDHTGNGVRSVQCRTTIQNDFQTADGDVRQQGSNGTVVDGTHAVDQCQGAVGAKAAQVEARRVGVLLTGLGGVDVSHCVGVLGVGKITNVLSHCRCTGLQQVFLADGVYGGGSGECTVT